MQRTLILALLASCSAFAQPETRQVFIGANAIAGGFQKMSAAPVQGAPYSATITNESVQTLADGNRIVQTSTGTIARDSLGRMRQDAPLPPIGNMSPADAPHLVFLQDPVAQTSYTLNLTDKTAVKNPAFSGLPALSPNPALPNVAIGGAMIAKAQPQTVTIQRTQENPGTGSAQMGTSGQLAGQLPRASGAFCLACPSLISSWSRVRLTDIRCRSFSLAHSPFNCRLRIPRSLATRSRLWANT